MALCIWDLHFKLYYFGIQTWFTYTFLFQHTFCLNTILWNSRSFAHYSCLKQYRMWVVLFLSQSVEFPFIKVMSSIYFLLLILGLVAGAGSEGLLRHLSLQSHTPAPPWFIWRFTQTRVNRVLFLCSVTATTSRGRHLFRCPNHLTWLLSMQRNSSSTRNPPGSLIISHYLLDRTWSTYTENSFQLFEPSALFFVIIHTSWALVRILRYTEQ